MNTEDRKWEILRVRSAVYNFITQPSQKTFNDIIRQCNFFYLPCESGAHVRGHNTGTDSGMPDCQGCPLWMDGKYFKIWQGCYVYKARITSKKKEIYESYKGELVIAFIMFNEGWVKIDEAMDRWPE